MERQMLSPREVGERLGVHVNTVKRMVADHAFEGVIRINSRGDLRIPAEEVEAFVRDHAWRPKP